MSNYECPHCGMTNIDCGKGGFKTPKEIELESRVKELEKENEALKAQRDTYISLMNIYKNISKGRQDSKNVTDYIKKLEQKLNAQFAEMEEKLTAEENKNFELKEEIKELKDLNRRLDNQREEY